MGLILKQGTQLLRAHDFERSFIIEKAAFSLGTSARKRQIEQIAICGKKIVLFSTIIDGYICKRIGQVVFIGWI